MNEDPIEPLMRHGTQLLGMVEADMSEEGRAWLQAEEARGGELCLTLNRRGEMWAVLIGDGRVRAVPWWLTRNGHTVSVRLPFPASAQTDV
ncbi:hypothetical protein OKW50_000690 [Paraburkholderia youngii]|uniref:hypothetical protein n=1 Tax=Paraburkholderia youngii TaxID=2782701 RepID=UPI003D1E3CD6